MSARTRIASAAWIAAWLALGAGCASACPRRVVLDLDPTGDFDDLVALWIAAVSPELDVLGAVVTSVAPEPGERAAAKALALVGRDDVRVHRGSTSTAPRPAFDYWAQFPRRDYGAWPELQRYGNDFPHAPDPQSGVELYLEAARSQPGGISIVTGTPLTTLAAALREAEARGAADAFRRGVGCLLMSGGDFGSAEWNVYADVPAARRVFASGIPIYQFGGEDEPKSRLRHPERQRLWQAATPLTRGLQDLYRLFQAGNDPTSPFVPILYDVHPVAFLIEGERMFRFEPVAVAIDDTGQLLRAAGQPNALVRIPGQQEVVVDWSVERLRAREVPAAAHLRAVGRLAAADAAASLGTALDAVEAAATTGRDEAALRAGLDAADAQLAPLGERADEARGHLALARRFLLGDPAPDAWRDPYTDEYIRRQMLWMRIPRRKLAAALAGLALALAAAATLRRWRRADAGSRA